jgi:outer membrane translocation and assembly module TamA
MNMKYFTCGTGFGVRYMTPVGPVGLDIAFRLDEAPYSSAHYQVALFIGYAF